MRRNFPINFQHITIQHHDIPYRNLIFIRHISKMLSGILWYITNQHNTHPSWITSYSYLSLSITYLIILIQFIKLQVLSLNLFNRLYIVINNHLTVFNKFVFHYKMYKSMTKFNIS